MKNGTTVIHKTDDGIQAVHFDQEVMEFAAQNARVKARQNKAARSKQMKAKKEACRKRAADKLSSQILGLVMGMAAVSILCFFGLVDYTLTLLLVGAGLVVGGIKVGRWLEWR